MTNVCDCRNYTQAILQIFKTYTLFMKIHRDLKEIDALLSRESALDS